MNLFSEKNLHRLFDAGIIIKAIDSVGETILGFLFLFLNAATMNKIVGAIFGDEIDEAPLKAIWSFALHSFAQASNNSQTFLAFLFIGHGLLKIILVAGLVKNKLWVFPVAAIAFTGFALYEIYQLFHTPSLLLDALTILDIIFIALIIHEYRYQKKYPQQAVKPL
jgi:uncharacterized membrane protein